MIFDDISPLLENPVRGSDYARSDGVVNVSGSLPEDEISLNVCFVHCHSPDSIFFRMPHHTKVYQEMMASFSFFLFLLLEKEKFLLLIKELLKQ